jgi:hypothetical protein
MKHILILLLLTSALSSALFSSAAYAQTKTSSTAESGLLYSLSQLASCTNDGHGFCPSMPVALGVFGFDRQFHALEAGIGFGVAYAFDAKKLHLELGLDVAPILRFDHVQQDSQFALLLNTSFYRGLGLGLGWRALAIGSSGGIQPLDKFHLFAFMGVDLLQAFKPAPSEPSGSK